jgi:hypothetical protein
LLASALLCAALFCLACGPIEYVNQVTRRASSEVDAAKAVKADKHAPYYYTLAVEYLNKAREEAAAADFQAANRFGRRSAEAARKARALAKERAANPKARPRIPDPDPDEDEDLGPEVVEDEDEESPEVESPEAESADGEGKEEESTKEEGKE